MKVYILSSPDDDTMLLTTSKEAADKGVEMGGELRMWDTDTNPHCALHINVGDDA